MIESNFLNWLLSIEHPILDFFMSLFQLICYEYIYFIFIPIIYWAIHKQTGFQLLSLFLFSMYVNSFIKDVFMIERPEVTPLDNGYSFPSAHTQAATTFWGYLIPAVTKQWFTIFACLMIALVAFSQLYSGAHWPFDVLGAIIIGAFLVYASYRSLDWTGGMPERIKLSLWVIIPVALFVLSPDQALFSGVLLGAGIGYHLEQTKNRMDIKVTFIRRVIAIIIGLMGIISLQTIGLYLPDQVVIEFIYAIGIGLWITYIAPILFVSLKIYGQQGNKIGV
ncbi:phosphatase PAP2 family protein [Alkalihalobacterium chitinilyticum]|uniref:Phosphatase PAP2 family protein n=1 Tax=Alkalihalobacterium chitinilyticum TaxID=2980103 RepID=A0ABT5V9W1_9BACI|nr:phosphatase PAP2 family protein [Alkalihalobacterium chitinilyticum]MDE5412264.1 phosphatase PAP2 family protein [Alkalihalobacterium chitinilyticum]